MLRKNNGNDGSRMYQFGTKRYSSEEILEKLEKGEISFEDFLNKCYIGEDLTDEEIEDDRREAMKIFADAFVVKQLQEKKIAIVILDEDDKPVEKKEVNDGKYKIAISYGDKNYSVSDFSFKKKVEASGSASETSASESEEAPAAEPEKFIYISEGKIIPKDKVELLRIAKKSVEKVVFAVGKKEFSVEDAAYLVEHTTIAVAAYNVSTEDLYPTRLDDEEVKKIFADYKKQKSKK